MIHTLRKYGWYDGEGETLILHLLGNSTVELSKEQRIALIDLRAQHLQARMDLVIAKGEAEGGPGTRDQVMERRRSFDERAEKEMEAVRAINRALGLPEDETSKDV